MRGTADLSKEVVVTSGGKELHRSVPAISLRTMIRTAERNDADLLFTASVPASGR